MRGLTDADYAELRKLNGPDFEEDFDEDPRGCDLVIARRVTIVDFEKTGPDPDDFDAEIMITPLGRLALSLWPAIRVGR